jgi:hypothetical protein
VEQSSLGIQDSEVILSLSTAPVNFLHLEIQLCDLMAKAELNNSDHSGEIFQGDRH